MVQLCNWRHKIRMNSFSPKILDEINGNLNELRPKKFKNDVDTLKLVATFFDIAYYNAVSLNKSAYLKRFYSMAHNMFQFFLYIGTKAYKISTILEKVKKKIEICRKEALLGSYFEIMSLKN